MKTKLLKKVRKRFEIIRVDRVDDPDHYYNKLDLDLNPGYPCYLLFDNDDPDVLFLNVSKDYEYIYERLRERITKVYYKKFKKHVIKTQKVWYK